MPKLAISLAQMNIALGDVRKNVAQMEKWALEASRRSSHMLVLPELWSTGGAWEQSRELASALNSGIFNEMSAAAGQNKMCLVGSVLERRGNEAANSAAFFAPNGRMLGIYRKLHLFRPMSEDKWLQPGASALALDLPWGNTGLAICYDLRFPEMFRKYAVDGARMIVVPSMWPIQRVEHWRTLVIARAIENQCYIVACNAVGQTGDTNFAGHSMIVDPWGKIVVEGGETPQLLTAEIEMDLVETVRNMIPILSDRRSDVYG
jgi:predicted amidohydrolase